MEEPVLRTVVDVQESAEPKVSPPAEVDAQRLKERLESTVKGEVRFDTTARGLYATDASNYRQVPIGVVLPRDKDDVVETVAACRDFGAPILGRGGGTSLAGQCCNVAVVLDFSKYMGEVLEIDPERRLARVEPGCVLDRLRDAAEEHGLTFGPDPATHDHCTLGGMIGNNSCGVHSQMSGRTADYVLELEVLTYDGERMRVGPTSDADFDHIIAEGGRRGAIYGALRNLRDEYAEEIRSSYPDIPRRVSGYNLDELQSGHCNVARALVGSESTCVIVLEATLQLIPSPRHRSTLLVAWEDIATLADHVPEIVEVAHPIGFEAFDEPLVTYMRRKHLHERSLKLIPEGGAWMIIEVGGENEDDAHEKAMSLKHHLDRMRRKNKLHPKRADYPVTVVYEDVQDVERIWEVRESGLGATARVPGVPDTWPGWEDSAVPPEHLGDYLRDLRALLEDHGYQASLYGHFGQGCVHTRLPFDLRTAEGIRTYRHFMEAAARLVVSYGGSLSGEHGDGQARAEFLSIMYGPAMMEAMRRFKQIWDPLGQMNPGKVIDPYPIDSNLRLGADHAPWEPRTKLDFPDDEGRFSRAALRCVGVGKCRRTDSGTMCPSYMVTREEEHSTRGRARLLYEMMNGDVVKDKWRAEEVRESLDLCISCKGCLGDCPVNVDMATYKAEFLFHYYKHNRRPRHAYALGYVDVAARVAAKAPRLANLVTQTPLSAIPKRLAGIAPERSLPAFATETFRTWFGETHEPKQSEQKVLLFPDTFTDHFHPHIGKAAVHVLEAAGYQVVLPDRKVCCGRPLYDYGLLRRAKRLLKQNIETMRSEIRNGTPMVVLEPSCAATFRDELPKVLPKDEDAKRLRDQTFTLAEFLIERPEALERLDIATGVQEKTRDRASGREREGPPHYLVHRHCHHQAVMGFDADQELMDRAGLDYEILDSGCCGLAGSFGFEEGHYDISMKMGERVLLPRVRESNPQTTILSDGFSCRTQIQHGTRREGHHLAEMLAARLDGTEDRRRQHQRPTGDME